MIDGQRQILAFLVPGDLIGDCYHTGANATTTLAVTEVMICPVPNARSGALKEHHLIAQITRIGRLDAYQRIADWMLETRERLASVGLANGSEFALP